MNLLTKMRKALERRERAAAALPSQPVEEQPAEVRAFLEKLDKHRAEVDRMSVGPIRRWSYTKRYVPRDTRRTKRKAQRAARRAQR